MSATEGSRLIDFHLMWTRLIAVVEEQALVLQRTAFSPIVREAGDLSAGVFDPKGRMLAQAVTGTPGHVNTMALSVGHVLDRYPAETMKDGDVYITNDPWLGTGHTSDFVVTTPCFRKGKLVGLFSCTCHVVDIGGLGRSVEGSDVFMEGLFIPILKLAEEGKVNETLMTMIGANSRTPIDTCGDTYSLMACNDVGCRRLVEMMDEFDLDSLDDLGEHIIDYSRNAVHAEIAKLPRGTWKHSMYLDGFDDPIYIEAALTVSENKIHIDFTGSGGMVRRGFNVPVCYTLAYTAFGVGCVIAKGIPNNAGSLEPITIHAPPGCILNADRPAAVFGRHLVGQMMPDLVFGCFRQFVPDRVPAEGAGAMWNVGVSGPRTSPPRIGDDYRVTLTSSGGMGALPYRDGLSTTAFPSGVRGTPVEIAEALTPLIFRRKEYEQDSAGAGRSRGGFGQIIEIENTLPELFRFHAMHWRIHHPAIGFDGGHNGANGYLGLKSGPRLRGMGVQEIPAGDNLIMRTPGGAGFGNPKDRDRDLVRSDLAEGLISERAAREIYGLESNA